MYLLAIPQEHECGSSTWCHKCQKHTEPTKLHPCFTPVPSESAKKKMKEKQENLKILAYDFECMQNYEEEGETVYLDKHEVVCVVIRKVDSLFAMCYLLILGMLQMFRFGQRCTL